MIFDWTPKEYQLKLRGAQHAVVDELERLSYAAIMQAKAANEKRMTAQKLFDTKKARRILETGTAVDPEAKYFVSLNRKLENYQPKFVPKGGQNHGN